MKLKNASKFTHLAMNLLPIVGAIFWGWTPFSVIFVYWLESLGIVGTTSVKILISKGDGNQSLNFSQCFWYGIRHTALLLFYLIFIVVFVGAGLESITESESTFANYLLFLDPSFRYSMLAFLLLKIVYFFGVFVKEKNYLHSQTDILEKEIQPRMITIHLVILFGLFAAMGMTFLLEINVVDSVFAIVFVSIKSAVDFFSSRKQEGV